MTRNDIQVCIRFIQCAILQSGEISVQFRLFVLILTEFGSTFVILYLLFMVCKDWCSHKTLKKNHLPYHFQTRCIWLIMTGDKRHFGSGYGILDISDTAFCLFVNSDLHFLLFLVG